jgi:hypothetical protein
MSGDDVVLRWQPLQQNLVPARLNTMTDSLNILRLLRHLLVALVRLHDGSVDVSQPSMMFVVHQSSVSTRTDDNGQDATQIRLRTSTNRMTTSAAIAEPGPIRSVTSFAQRVAAISRRPDMIDRLHRARLVVGVLADAARTCSIACLLIVRVMTSELRPTSARGTHFRVIDDAVMTSELRR